MNIDSDIKHYFMVMLAIIILTTMLTYDIVNKMWERSAIQQGNGYYDPQTADFKWNSEG